MFQIYCISHDTISDELQAYKILDIISSNKHYIDVLIKSIKYFCKCDNVIDLRSAVEKYILDKESYKEILDKLFVGYEDIDSFLLERNCIIINNNVLDKNKYDEFAEIIRTIHGLHIPEKQKEPRFKTEEGRQSWLKLQEYRKKYAEKNNKTSIENVINVVQNGGKSYIPSSEIKKWCMWKLMNEYASIISKDSYESSFKAALQGADNKDALKKHWTELLKVT